MEKLKRELQERCFADCYLLYGTESYLKNRYEGLFIKAFQNDVVTDMNITLFDSEVTVNKLIESVETLPLFAEKRLVLVKDSKIFKTGKKNDSDRLAEYLTQLPKTTCLVFIEEEVDKRNKLWKVFDKLGRCIECTTPKEPQLIQWIKKEFRKNEIQIELETAVFFFRYVGESMENAYTEIEKLSAYKNKGDTVTHQDIEAVCVQSLDIRVFELVSAVGERQTKKAVLIYRNMLMMKESPIMILVMISRQFRLMLQCKLMEMQGQGVSEMARRLSQRDFVIKKSLIQSRNFTLETLKKAFYECLETDIAIKTGLMKDEMAVELMIIKYSN